MLGLAMTARKKDVSDVTRSVCFAWISWNGPDSAWTFAVAHRGRLRLKWHHPGVDLAGGGAERHLASVFVLTPHATGDAIYPPVAELMLSALRYD